MARKLSLRIVCWDLAVTDSTCSIRDVEELVASDDKGTDYRRLFMKCARTYAVGRENVGQFQTTVEICDSLPGADLAEPTGPFGQLVMGVPVNCRKEQECFRTAEGTLLPVARLWDVFVQSAAEIQSSV